MLDIGVLTPHAAAGADDEFTLMAGGRLRTRVGRISVSPAGGQAPSSPDELRAHAHASVVEAVAATLDPVTLDALAYASTSSAYVIGPQAERDLVARLSDRWGLPACSTPASVVDALRRFDVERLVIMHPPWFGEDRNALGVAYFLAQGFSVVGAELIDVADDPALVTPDQVVDWVSSNVSDDVEAIFLGGNGFRAAGAIHQIEQHLGCLVVESNQVLLWSILAGVGADLRIRGFGRLFDMPPRD